MKITFLGGADEVGASCTLIELAEHRIVVDCGIRMVSGDKLPWIGLIEEAGGADAILITHAHTDHTGALPLLVQTSPAPIYMTPPTMDLTHVLLKDSLKIMQIESEKEGEVPLYPPAAVELTMSLIDPVHWGEPREILGGAARITYLPAGHVLGASSILLETDEGSILMGGDISKSPQLTVGGFDWSSIPAGSIDAVICESTYGGKSSHASRRGEENRLVSKIKTVMDRGGAVLIPAFALGRAQEVLGILDIAVEKKQLPAVPIYADGMVRMMCRVYRNHPRYAGRWLKRKIKKSSDPFFGRDNFHPVGASETRHEIVHERPMIVIASSGMLTGGPSAFYASKFASDARNEVFITGYQDAESPGYKVRELAQNGGGKLRLGDEAVEFACPVSTYSLSAHADTTEITAALAALRPRNVFLVHGDRGAREGLQKALNGLGVRGVHTPKLGESFEIKGRRRKRDAPLIPSEETNYQSKPINPQDLRGLAEFLFARDLDRRSYTTRQLLEEWGDEAGARDQQELQRAAQILKGKHSPFKGKKGKFRIRHFDGNIVGGWKEGDAVPSSNAQAVSELVRETFKDPSWGFYKAGQNQGARIVTLNFHFPDVVKPKIGEIVERLEKDTGWKMKIKEQPHSEALGLRAMDALPEKLRAGVPTPSIHLVQKQVQLKLPGPVPVAMFKEVEERQAAFLRDTGFVLILKNTGAAPPPEPKPNAGVAPTAMNMAKAREVALKMTEALPVPVLKVSFKNGVMVLVFVTWEIGEQHRQVLDNISSVTGWDVDVHPNPNQQAMQALLRQFLEPGQNLKISLRSGEKVLQIQVSGTISPEKKARMTETFFLQTRWRLRFGRRR